MDDNSEQNDHEVDMKIMDELNYEKWSQIDVLNWVKLHLAKNGFENTFSLIDFF